MTVILDGIHSPIGASQAERWWLCPGSVARIQASPPAAPSKYAAEGTVAHTVAERYLTAAKNHGLGVITEEGVEVLPPDIYDDVGRDFIADGFEFEVTDEMVAAVEVYVTLIEDLMHEYSLTWDWVQVEKRFCLSHIDDEAFGTSDCSLVVPMNRLIVVDYKHGKGYSVDIDMNKQLMMYALGVYYELPEWLREDLLWVEIIIVQPRDSSNEEGVRRMVYPISILFEYERGLTLAIQRVRSGNDTLLAGKHCKFCPAKPTCPAFRAHMNEQAAMDFSNAELELVTLPPPSVLNPEHLARLIENANLIKDWASAVLAHAHTLAERGVKIPGYELVEKTGNRRWKNTEEVEKVYSAKLGERAFNQKLKSPAQMEKMLSKQEKAELEAFWEKPVTGKTLVQEGSGRPKALPDNVMDFEVFKND